jgi:CheY-like chemotaxis protein
MILEREWPSDDGQEHLMKAMVFDDDPVICAFLCMVLRRRGYEAVAFPDAAYCPCPVSRGGTCSRPEGKPCADVIMSDIEMPKVDGLGFVEGQFRKHCRCSHVALISGCWSESNVNRARQLPVKIMAKPASVAQVDAWLDEVEKAS